MSDELEETMFGNPEEVVEETAEEVVEEDTTKYAYKGQVHHPGDKDPCEICLTEDDLNPRKDPVLAPLMNFMNREEHKNYIKMPVIRDLQTFLLANEARLTEEFIRYKKRGRIKPLAEIETDEEG